MGLKEMWERFTITEKGEDRREPLSDYQWKDSFSAQSYDILPGWINFENKPKGFLISLTLTDQ